MSDVKAVSEATIPTRYGSFRCHAYASVLDGEQHVAVVRGAVSSGAPVLVRLHSECLTGDVLGSLRCDCGEQLDAALRRIAAEGAGVLVYLRGHEGRGIGIGHKLRAYQLQEQGRDTVDANTDLGLPVDRRDYGIGAQILADLGVRSVRLLTNNPAKVAGLVDHGIDVVERLAIRSRPNAHNEQYLRTKRDRLGHLLDGIDPPDPS